MYLPFLVLSPPLSLGVLSATGLDGPLELADGDTLDLEVGPVAKRLGEVTVRMLGYNGSIPGPTLKVRQGSEIVVHVTNGGDLDTTVHWHGLRLENPYDGVPHEIQAPIPVGGEFTYRSSSRMPGCTGTTPMRIESSVTSLSWIPQGAVEGFNRLSFGLRIAHFRVNVTKVGFGSASITFAPIVLPELRPDPETGPGWVRFVQTAGGQTGFPTPRRVRHEPYVQITGPVTWSTLALTITPTAGSSHGWSAPAPSPALGPRPRRPADRQERVHRPRHLVVARPSAATRPGAPRTRSRSSPRSSRRWSAPALGGRHRRQAAVPPAPGRPHPGPPGRAGDELFLLFDGVLRVEIDDRPVTEVGPGVILGEMALLRDGRRTATLRAVTPCRVAVVPKDGIDRQT